MRKQGAKKRRKKNNLLRLYDIWVLYKRNHEKRHLRKDVPLNASVLLAAAFACWPGGKKKKKENMT